MYKSYYPKASEIERKWYVADANGQNLGRFAANVVRVLLGKHKPTFTPGVEMGNFVVVINAGLLELTGKRMDTKFYHAHSGYPGGLKTVSLREQLRIHPDRVIRAAVWGMIPHNKYGRKIIKNLKIYAGKEHPHAAQNPKPVAV